MSNKESEGSSIMDDKDAARIADLVRIADLESENEGLREDIEADAVIIYSLKAENERLREMLKDGKGARSIAMKTAAWLAMMSHDTEADALDLCERMRIKSINVRGELDDAAREGE